MVKKHEILEEVLNYVNTVKDLGQSIGSLDLARRARRTINLILSQGIIDTLLFGYSKCGNSVILKSIKNLQNLRNIFSSSESEKAEWALIMILLLEYPLRKMGYVDINNESTLDLMALLNKLLNEKDVSRKTKLENLSIQYLIALTRLWKSIIE